MKLLMCALLTFLLAYNCVSAFDGNALLDECSVAIRLLDQNILNKFDDHKVHFCFGYIQGILATTRLYQESSRQTYFCLPSIGSVTNGQASRIVVNYLKKHPEKLHSDGVLLAHLAFTDAFPCEN